MKTIGLAILGVWFATFSLDPAHAGTAAVRLVNESIRIHPGICSCGGGLDFTMYFSTIWTEDTAYANEEVAPLLPPANYNHWTYLVLEDVSMFASATYAELDLPLTTDTNGDGIPEFYDVNQSVSAQTGGRYAIIWGPGYGQLILNWNRSAGSRFGSCQLYMNDSILGLMGPFNLTFEILEYTGQLSYKPGTNSVTGTLQIATPGQASEMWSGPVTLTRNATNRFNLLTLTSGGLTNQASTFAFNDCAVIREPGRPDTYHGPLQNLAGNWSSWQISIVDTNDANGNGIPDLSDDLVMVSPPRPPVLSLTRTGTNLLLSISGDVGHTNQIQQATTPRAVNWTTIATLQLTNDPQVVTLPLPISNPTFWRVQSF